jgi:hypothetical protein
MATLNIEGKHVQVDDSFLKLSPEEQDSTVAEIARSIGPPSGPAAAPDIGDNRASLVAGLRGIPIAGAVADYGTAALNAAAQPLLETGMSHAPTFSERLAENRPKVTAGTNAYETSHPIGTTIGKMAIGSGAVAPLAASATAAKLLGMSGTLPAMIRNGVMSNSAIGAVDAAARGGGSGDIGKEAVESGVAGGAFPVAGRALGSGVRAIRNLVSSAPRAPLTVGGSGPLANVRVPQSYHTPTNEIGSQEQAAKAGALGPEPQQVAQRAGEETGADTQQAAQQFGQTLNPGAATPATPHAAADQTITELAQQHNDQVAAQARHEAQIAAEGTSLRGNVAAPLGAPEPAQPTSVVDAITGIQGGVQQRAQAARQNVTNRYDAAAQFPGDYAPAAFGNIGQSIRNRIEGAVGAGVRPVTINPQLTPHASAMLDLLDNRLGNNYYENALRRGDMVRAPDGRIIPRPLTPADVESARQEMVSHLQDARSAARAPGGSGTDAYAAQRVMDAFNGHHDAVLNTPGAFSGDGPGYNAAIRAARAAHSERRATYSNQGGGDTIGPVVERIVGRHPGQEMPVGQMATSIFGTPTSPGGGNSQAIAARVRQIVGANSPEHQAMRQGMLAHILDTPEGMAVLPPAKQADRLQTYLQTPHARDMFTPAERTRLMAHAQDLRAQAAPALPMTPIERQIAKLAGANGEPASPSELVKKVFPATGEVIPGADKLLDNIHARVSTANWNQYRQAMWTHLLETPEGVTDFGPQKLSQRLAKFLASPIAPSLYSESELSVMRQFAEHYGKLTPLPNTTNPSGSATMAAKLVRGMGNHIFSILGFGGGHVTGALVGHAADTAVKAVKTARQLEKTKELFLGKKPKGSVNPNYERAAAVLAHAATPLTSTDHARTPPR